MSGSKSKDNELVMAKAVGLCEANVAYLQKKKKIRKKQSEDP